MKNKLIYLLAALTAFLCILNAAAADYSFKVPSAQTYVLLEPDGSMTVNVEYSFENLGQKLDYIDIGLPNNNYTLGEIQVWVNGMENSEVKVTKADYSQSGLRYGITLEMRGASIPSGGSGTVEVTIPNLRKNMFEASSETYGEEEVEFVGFEFSPNYFGKKYVSGTTDYSFTIAFPAGVSGGRVYYYSPQNWPGAAEPDAWITEEGRGSLRLRVQLQESLRLRGFFRLRAPLRESLRLLAFLQLPIHLRESLRIRAFLQLQEFLHSLHE